MPVCSAANRICCRNSTLTPNLEAVLPKASKEFTLAFVKRATAPAAAVAAALTPRTAFADTAENLVNFP